MNHELGNVIAGPNMAAPIQQQQQENEEQHQQAGQLEQHMEAHVEGEMHADAAVQQVPQVIGAMPVNAEIQNQAANGQQVAQPSTKAQKRMQKQAAAQAAAQAEANARQNLIHNALEGELNVDEIKNYLKAIDEEEKEQLRQQANNQIPGEKERIRMEAQQRRYRVMGRYAGALQEGSEQRAAAYKLQEKMGEKAYHLRCEYKITQIQDEVQRKREKATLKRHDRYDFLRSIIKAENPLSHVGAEYPIAVGGQVHVLVNVGRAFMGGTKPMYIFEDRNDDNKQYLFKEAVNCIGMEKTEGALLTEAAAKLQEELSPDTCIRAFTAVLDGKVWGSFQEKVDNIPGHETEAGGFDLFAWQAHPQEGYLPPEVSAAVLREHTLDWLLCNFDTKGENFLQRRVDHQWTSFDKEASFRKIKDEKAQNMSYTYKPHSNDTVYNVMFREYAAGNLQLDLDSVFTQIQRVQAMNDDAYYDMFKTAINAKYTNPEEANGIKTLILARKRSLRQEYEQFFGKLVLERIASLKNKLEAFGNPRRMQVGGFAALEQMQLVDEIDNLERKINRQGRPVEYRFPANQ